MKRAISPLIATVLLIGFTVALAAVIMTWGQGFTKKITGETETTTEQALECAKLSNNLKISKVDCINKKVEIKSATEKQIILLRFSLYKPTVTEREDDSTLIGGFDIKTLTLTKLDTTVTRIEAIPTIAGSAGKKDFTCADTIILLENPCAE